MHAENEVKKNEKKMPHTPGDSAFLKAPFFGYDSENLQKQQPLKWVKTFPPGPQSLSFSVSAHWDTSADVETVRIPSSVVGGELTVRLGCGKKIFQAAKKFTPKQRNPSRPVYGESCP